MADAQETRGRPSRIQRLPAKIRQMLDELLQAGITQAEILNRLQAAGEAPLSKSGLNRYASKMEKMGKHIHEMREAAAAWSTPLNDVPGKGIAQKKLSPRSKTRKAFLGSRYLRSPCHAAKKDRKKAGKPSAKILQQDRHLLNSLTAYWDKTEAQASTNVIYAATHQFGAKKGKFGRGDYQTRKDSFPIPWGDVPTRPFLGISQADKNEIENTLARFINKQWR